MDRSQDWTPYKAALPCRTNQDAMLAANRLRQSEAIFAALDPGLSDAEGDEDQAEELRVMMNQIIEQHEEEMEQENSEQEKSLEDTDIRLKRDFEETCRDFSKSDSDQIFIWLHNYVWLSWNPEADIAERSNQAGNEQLQHEIEIAVQRQQPEKCL